MSALSYRPEVDGLRALAVMPVILFHAGFSAFSGGFVGVDIFFVISGYLITSIILADLAQGRFSFGSFYERRARRILPALFLVTAVATVFAWHILLPSQFEEFGESIGTMVLFLSNHYFQQKVDYFGQAAELRPMLHTWSLSVEEQFYVLFPPLLLGLWWLGMRRLWPVLLALGGASLWAAHFAQGISPEFAFFSLPTRAFELIVGALLATLGLHGTAAQERRWLAEAGALAGVALLTLSVFWLDKGFVWPGPWTLLPVVGTMLVIAFATPATLVGRLLCWRPVVLLGLISYSAYLWHQPVFALTRLSRIEAPGPSLMALLILLTLALAALTWRIVERPMRDRRRFSRGQIFAGAAVISAAIFAFGLASRINDGFPSRLSLEMARIDSIRLDRNPRYQDCRSNRHQFIPPQDSCVYGDPAAPSIALVGDSHVNALAPALEQTLGPRGIGLRELSYGGCPVMPGLGPVVPGFTDCDRYTGLAYDWLSQMPQITSVIVNLRWPLYMTGASFDNGEGGVEVRAPNIESAPDIPDVQTRADLIAGIYVGAIAQLRAMGLRVVLVYSVPEMGWDVPHHLVREMRYGIMRTEPLSIASDSFRARNARVEAALDAIPDGPDLIRIRPADLWCDTLLPERCVAQDADLQLLYFDDDHVSRLGARLLAHEIIAAMEAASWLTLPPRF
jgi:peptidoglycan/LPS O-acetylase OafA/YrhL